MSISDKIRAKFNMSLREFKDYIEAKAEAEEIQCRGFYRDESTELKLIVRVRNCMEWEGLTIREFCDRHFLNAEYVARWMKRGGGLNNRLLVRIQNGCDSYAHGGITRP